ncbi:MAG TPA: DUF5916 domain-containing protein [Gemmatimonadales bacterium]|nr:DUF5916 domain-containing protein [Gemmatimonadales bacterium]
MNAVARGAIALALSVPTAAASAQQANALDTAGARGRSPTSETIRATVILGAVTLDGRLDERFWTTADSIDELRQREPVTGAPATERTVVKVAHDAQAVYVVVRCHDSNMRGVRASQLRRDADLSSDDNVQLLIDSFDDRRSAFVFATNPNGAMWDAQFSGVDDVNENWNGVWDVAVTRDSAGWTAEFRIPLLALRFHAGTNPRFGFNVRRFIRRKNEEDLWRSYGRAQGLYHLDQEGELVVPGELQRPHDVEVYPYLLGRAVETEHDSLGSETTGGFLGGKTGLDAKLGITPTLTADITVSTDFAQVEADQQVINLTRFPFFFPEKREFFLESGSLFDLGRPGVVQLFYSRRVGLDTSGAPVPIVGGARLYGRLGPWKLGILDAQTGGGEDANDAVVRVQRDLFDRSYIGAIGTVHAAPRGQGVARAGGVDLDLPLVVHGANLEPKVWIAGSQTRGVAGTPLVWRISTDNPNDLFDNFVALYRIDSAFAPPLGFVRRTGIWETTGHVDFTPRPGGDGGGLLGIRKLDFTFPIPSWDIIANETGSVFRSADWQTARFEWRVFGGDRQNGDHFEVNFQRLMDAPTDTFTIFRGVVVQPGRYWWSRSELQYSMSPGRPLSVGAFVNWGQFYGGHSTDLELTAAWRGGGHIIVSTALTRTTAQLPVGAFTAVLSANRVEYDFDTRTSLLAFVQYDNETQRVDFNVRFHWIPVIGDDVFLVWNSGYTTDPLARFRFPDTRALSRPLNGAFVVKAVHRLTP